MRLLAVRTWIAAALIQCAAWVLGCEVVTTARTKTARSREDAEALCR